jgi:hypothetical protein
MKHILAALLLSFVGVGLQSQPPPCLAIIQNSPPTRNFPMVDGRNCYPQLPRHFVDQLPVGQADGSYLIPLPLPGAFVDVNTIELFANGERLTAVPTATQPMPDYSLDPANPLHVIPSSGTAANWPLWELRASLTVVL